jgi:hypothetical protein
VVSNALIDLFMKIVIDFNFTSSVIFALAGKNATFPSRGRQTPYRNFESPR